MKEHSFSVVCSCGNKHNGFLGEDDLQERIHCECGMVWTIQRPYQEGDYADPETQKLKQIRLHERFNADNSFIESGIVYRVHEESEEQFAIVIGKSLRWFDKTWFEVVWSE